jgi:RimJ/RimL family protein N-acetyltransferase
MPEITAARLRLSRFSLDDLDELAAIWADPEVMKHVTGQPRSRQASHDRLQESTRCLKALSLQTGECQYAMNRDQWKCGNNGSAC